MIDRTIELAAELTTRLPRPFKKYLTLFQNIIKKQIFTKKPDTVKSSNVSCLKLFISFQTALENRIF